MTCQYGQIYITFDFVFFVCVLTQLKQKSDLLRSVKEANSYAREWERFFFLTVSNMNCTIVCREDFYLDETVGYCRPHCGRWKAYSPTDQTVQDSFIIMSAAGAIIAVVILITLAFFRHKKAWVITYSSSTHMVGLGTIDTDKTHIPSPVKDSSKTIGCKWTALLYSCITV